MSLFDTASIVFFDSLKAVVRKKPPAALARILRDSDTEENEVQRLIASCALAVVRWEGSDAPAAWPPLTYKGDDADMQALQTRMYFVEQLPLDVIVKVLRDTTRRMESDIEADEGK